MSYFLFYHVIGIDNYVLGGKEKVMMRFGKIILIVIMNKILVYIMEIVIH